ncbi:MAG: hypothetical protein Q7S95_02905 [bacterium]|nr:hypothetical protein [bacterium]
MDAGEMLTPEEFNAHVALGTLRLAFVGMSNGGKSYRSRILHQEEGFLWYHVDEEIQKALEFADMAQISAWLGYPSDAQYPERERRYLELEDRFTRNASMRTGGRNLVFDTTGSVVHLTPNTLEILRQNCLVVHLDVGEGSLRQMTERFFAKPKPVAWCGYYEEHPGDSAESALRRSYPALLRERLARYRELAHITIPASELRGTTARETLALIRSRLTKR